MSKVSAQSEQLLSDAQVATAYGVHRVTAWKWARQGRIPKPVEGPGGKRWLKSEIEAHIGSLRRAELKEMAS